MRKLSPNHRAQALARSCGFEGVSLVGDVFVGRSRMFPKEGIKVESFRVNDLASDAVWMRDLIRQNYDYAVKTNMVGMHGESGSGAKAGEGAVEAGSNSASASAYKWSETKTELVICLFHPPSPLPPITSRTVSVSFQSRGLIVTTKDGSSSLLAIANFKGAIRPSECTWTVNKEGLEITMEKVEEKLWTSLA